MSEPIEYEPTDRLAASAWRQGFLFAYYLERGYGPEEAKELSRKGEPPYHIHYELTGEHYLGGDPEEPQPAPWNLYFRVAKHREPCPGTDRWTDDGNIEHVDCSGRLRSGPGGGVECDTCDYWFCY